MPTKTNMALRRSVVILSGAIISLMVIGLLLFPRPELPKAVTEDYCAHYGIRFDASSIERIYLNPQGVAADPVKYLQTDQAYRLFSQHRERVHEPFPYGAWIKGIRQLASKPDEQRKQQAPFHLYELILKNQNSFCLEVVTSVMPYLPDGVDTEVTIHLTALEGSAPAFSKDREIAFSLSHPLFSGLQLIHEPTGVSAFYNLGLHELSHIYFGSVYKWPSLEEHMANEVVMDMLIALQNEGIATHISHLLNPRYPSPFEWFLYVIDQKPVVRRYIMEMNKLFAIAQTHPTGEAYDAIYREIASLGYQRKKYYIVGAYMAGKIESELDREALVRTVADGCHAFANTYLSVAEEDMKIHWSTTP